MATTTIFVTIPNRSIKHGEYGCMYGACESHRDVLLKHLFRMTLVDECIEGDSLVLTLEKKGALGKRNTEELWMFTLKQFITAIKY